LLPRLAEVYSLLAAAPTFGTVNMGVQTLVEIGASYRL